MISAIAPVIVVTVDASIVPLVLPSRVLRIVAANDVSVRVIASLPKPVILDDE